MPVLETESSNGKRLVQAPNLHRLLHHHQHRATMTHLHTYHRIKNLKRSVLEPKDVSVLDFYLQKRCIKKRMIGSTTNTKIHKYVSILLT